MSNDARSASVTAVATANGLLMLDQSLKVRQVLGRRDGLLADHVTDVVFRDRGIVVATPAGPDAGWGGTAGREFMFCV